MKKLYHKEVFWKKEFDTESINLVESVNRLSFHLQNHLNNPDIKHKYSERDIWNCLNKIKQNKGYLFEVETDNGQITKAVYRVAYNNNYDMCIVVRYRFIVTAWTNKNTDTHTTLDSDKYIKG